MLPSNSLLDPTVMTLAERSALDGGLDYLTHFNVFDHAVIDDPAGPDPATDVVGKVIRLTVSDLTTADEIEAARVEANTRFDLGKGKDVNHGRRYDADAFAEIIGATSGNGLDWIPGPTVGKPSSHEYLYSDQYEVPDQADPFVHRLFIYDGWTMERLTPYEMLARDGHIDLRVVEYVYVHMKRIGQALCHRTYERDTLTRDIEAVTCPECAKAIADYPVLAEPPVYDQPREGARVYVGDKANTGTIVEMLGPNARIVRDEDLYASTHDALSVSFMKPRDETAFFVASAFWSGFDGPHPTQEAAEAYAAANRGFVVAKTQIDPDIIATLLAN